VEAGIGDTCFLQIIAHGKIDPHKGRLPHGVHWFYGADLLCEIYCDFIHADIPFLRFYNYSTGKNGAARGFGGRLAINTLQN
jgi:hypothetical protein